MSDGTKWLAGTAYGPVLSTTDLYLLNPKVEIHPVLAGSCKKFRLTFHLPTGRATGMNENNRDVDFQYKDEVATLPRLAEIIIISEASPWCTIVKNPQGVTLSDVCGTIWREYTENAITDDEFAALPAAIQDSVRRCAMNRESGGHYAWAPSYADSFSAGRCRRADWLRDKVFFESLGHNDDFARRRLGFSAPNVFIMRVMS